MKRVIIDGNNALYRAIHVQANLSNGKGEYTGGCFGLLKILENISYMGKMTVVFDGKDGGDYRRKIYPEYKMNRFIPEDKKTDEDRLTEHKKEISFKQCYEILPALGISHVYIDGLEADDLIYTLAKHYQAQGDDVTVVSEDQDFLQLIPMGIKIYQPTKRLMMNEENFVKKFGFGSQCSVLAKSLQGDTSDNIKGVHGIGPKTIEKIMKEIESPTIENILGWADTGKTTVAKGKLLLSRDVLELNTKIIDLTKSGLPHDKVAERCLLKMNTTQKDKVKAKELIKYLDFDSLYGMIDREY